MKLSDVRITMGSACISAVYMTVLSDFVRYGRMVDNTPVADMDTPAVV